MFVRNFFIGSVFLLASYSAHAGLASVIAKLTDSGARVIEEQTAAVIARGVGGLAGAASTSAMKAVSDIMMNAATHIKPEAFKAGFSAVDALDIYFYKLADSGYLTSLEAAGKDPADYIKKTASETIAKLNQPGACNGGSCSGAFKYPESINGDEYLANLKKGVLSDADIQVKLPTALKRAAGDAVGETEIKLEDLFLCTKK